MVIDRPESVNLVKPPTNIIKDTKPLRKGELTPEIFQEYANLAAKVQKDSEEAVLNLIYSKFLLQYYVYLEDF